MVDATSCHAILSQRCRSGRPGATLLPRRMLAARPRCVLASCSGSAGRQPCLSANSVARRHRTPQLRIRRGQRRLPEGTADRSRFRDGLLGRGDDLPSDALAERGRRRRAARARRASAPTPQARAAKAATDRDRGFLAAVDALFGDWRCGGAARRARAGDGRRCTRGCPDDPDVATFYALALLGTMARGLAGAADAHEGHSAALAGQRHPDARDVDSRTACCARTPTIPAHCTTCCTTTTIPRTRASHCRPRAPTPRSRRRRVTRSTCRRTSSCSSGCGTTPRFRIGRRMPRPMRGSKRNVCRRPCAAITRCRGSSTSCCSWDATRGARHARADRTGGQGDRRAASRERAGVDARALRDRHRALGAAGSRAKLRQRQRIVRDRHERGSHREHRRGRTGAASARRSRRAPSRKATCVR